MPPPVPGVDGNWSCPACQNVNFAVRMVCNRCTAAKPPQFGNSKGGCNRGPVAGVDGNWACPSCQNVNFAIREACNRCQEPKPEEEVQQMYSKERTLVSLVAGKVSVTGRAPPVAGVDGNWACALCENVNYAVRDACNRCHMPKQEAMQLEQPPQHSSGGRRPVAGSSSGNWECPLCQNMNFAARNSCNICSMPRPEDSQVAVYVPPQQASGKGGAGRSGPVAGVDGNWACKLCNNVNFAVREVCNMCKAPQHQQSGGQWGASGRGGPIAGVDGNWACPFCSNVNYAIRDACNRCSAPKQTVPKPQQYSSGVKGRPVPGVDGNWACLFCNNVNYAIREMCNRCSAPRRPAVVPPFMQPNGGKGGPVHGGDGNWVCPQCQNVNFPHRTSCNRCQAPMPGSRSAGRAPVAGVDGNWACPQCQNINFAYRSACNRCQTPCPGGSHSKIAQSRGPVAGVDGNWACPLCQNVNFAMRDVCNRCMGPKPEEEVIEEQELEEVYDEDPPAKRIRK